jgi:hypothetical protein
MRLCWHRYLPVRVTHVRDVSFGEPGVMRTDVYQRCVKCQKPRLKRLPGFWRLCDLLPAEGGDGA